MRPPPLVLLTTVIAFASATPASAADYPMPGVVTGDLAAHDPSLLKSGAGYLLYSTHDRIEMRSSGDRTQFDRAGSAFTSVLAWVYDYNADGDVWAPDTSFHAGQYWMYYSASGFGSNHSAIGLATSPTGEPGSWQDQGIVHATTTADDHNAIDPNLLVDSQGRWWLSFGSFWTGIRLIQLDPATGMRHPTDQVVHRLATRQQDPQHAVEAPAIVERDGMYYLFVSFDRCCQGAQSTYRIMVGRSAEPTGPYLDAAGTPMTEGGGTEVLASHANIIGPGGQSVLADSDGDLLVYHYYDANAGGAHRLGINLLGWEQGWPRVR
ncbi:arabinan endo-1,5-alpha-L-arabinosidase [Saccharopolyspora mangrovi]|uniref:Arabinan endo-1,5-alpha-L-arabinosidase n=1 Tax=Saccharopolyspora mangrovi TaxID=3082379 RepID=A0ABU6AC71_9PSEU|nr:arabinan endo-1,5-alpha-L-arabinosidase [Saccharopolyspora sp. S2-29]MEB3368925.1 arabinan endo-1,5-alpha-L-arabinosidase [Saccharopolyspora sp. S2-29]